MQKYINESSYFLITLIIHQYSILFIWASIMNHQNLINRPSIFKHFLAFLSFIVYLTNAYSDFKLLNIADNQLQKIFYVQQKSENFFLTLSCKQKNMLSLFISTELNHNLAPRFNIYGNMTNTPNMDSKEYSRLSECEISVQLNTSNLIEIRRLQSSSVLMTINGIIFQTLKNQFILGDQSVKWGIGQRFQKNFDLKDGKWTIWNRDKPWKIDKGNQNYSEQTYGHHPVYLARSKVTRLYHLMYFRNTHGMLLESQNKSDRLIFNYLGGNIHLIIICGGNDPQVVIEQYHSYIGSSHIPPFWSLGFHQSRWGYKNLGYIEQVVQQYRKHDLPLDCFWTDLDYMKNKRIFTIDEDNFRPKQLNALIKKYGLHYVPLLDVAISVDDTYAVKLGTQMDVFLYKKDKPIDTYYIGEVWPGKVYYIDYLHPNASAYWNIQLKRLNRKINFSGIWLDMNEPTNFKAGEYAQEPFKIQHKENINAMTIDVNLQHYSEHQQVLLHREVHSYYGHLSSVPTFQYLNQSNRPFIISRSTSVGSGLFAGHWTGDNVANWQFLRLSINGNFLFQIFGIQMVGADICGFYQDTEEQLCSRWMQLGSFYPFARNHNHQSAVSQQPYSFGQVLLQTSKICLQTRYSLLKQIYTFMIIKKGKGSIFRPLSFQFFDDQNVYEQQTIQTQFLLGKYLMVAPIVYENSDERYVYFPGQDEYWYQFRIDTSNGKVRGNNIPYFMSSSGETIQNILPAPPSTFLRGGYILFTNEPKSRSRQLTNNFHLFAALHQNNAQSQIMGINDYQNNNHIEKCISGGCFFKIELHKIDGSMFHLEWKFIGQESVIGQLLIESILIVDKINKWRYEQPLLVNTVFGTLTLGFQEITQ